MPASEGQFGLTQIPGAAGLFIRVGQWLIGDGFENYEHAAVAIDDATSGAIDVMEAEPGGARISTYNFVQFTWSNLSLTLEQAQAVSLAAIKYKNVPYSFLDYFAIALHKWHIPIPGLRKYISSTRHMICSQLVDQCFKDAGVQLFDDGRWSGYVTPGDLYKLLSK
jgi:hypothetical protein